MTKTSALPSTSQCPRAAWTSWTTSSGATQSWDKFGLLPINYCTDPQIAERLAHSGNVLLKEDSNLDPKMLAVVNELFNTGN